MLRSRLPLFILACALTPVAAANADDGDATVAPVAHARISIENMRLPQGEHVGLLGTSYLVDAPLLPGLSIGPAVYGGITGQRGGFFTIGGEAAWRHPLAGPLGVEAGLYAGGGGGGAAPVGGGLMLRPHLDLLWDFGPLAVGLSVSRVRFPSGKIDSTQVGIVVDAINDFRHVPASLLSTPTSGAGRNGLGFDRIQLVAGAYRTAGHIALIDGSLAPQTVALLGVRAEQSFGSNTYWGLEANGAAQPGVAGYAEYLGLVGYETEAVPGAFNVGARVALGMGGGGGIPTGGGFLGKGAVYGIVRLSNQLGLALDAGYADAPNGRWRAAEASVALVWSLDSAEGSALSTRPARTDFSAGVERYRAARKDGSTRPLEADVLRIDRYLGERFYLSGEAHSAWGGDAGGYTAALLGAGWNQPLTASLHAGVEMLAGASGGGGVDSHGLLVQPSVWLGWQLSPAVALRIGAGRVKAPRGPLSSTALMAGLVFTYGVAGS
ncbi:MAG: hypothetical protein M3Y55_05925 [Pseudomonadota bacterium]|nr:hypothetical protein [Pseudomonadota bacterium]